MTRAWTILPICALWGLTACGGGHSAATTTPAPGHPDDVPVVRADKQLPDALTEPDVIAPPVVKTPHDSVVLVAAGDPPRLMPLGCYDVKEKTFLDGDPCLDKVGEQSELRLDSGGNVTGDDIVPVEHCSTGIPDPGHKQRALEVNGQTVNEATLAVWPKDSPRPDVAGGVTWSPTLDELTMLRKTLHAVAPEMDGKLEVHQTFTRDLDGDGKPDHVYSTLLRDETGKAKLPLLGNIVIEYSGTGQVIAFETTRTDEDPKLSVLATLDVDGDGKREMVVRWSWREKRYFHLDKVGDHAADRVGAVSCSED